MAEWSAKDGHEARDGFIGAVKGAVRYLVEKVRESILDDVRSGVAGSEEAYCRAYRMVDGEWRMTRVGRDALLGRFDDLWRQSEIGVDAGRGGRSQPVWAKSLEGARSSEQVLSALLLVAQTD